MLCWMYYAMYRDEQRVAVLIISHYYKYGNAASSLSFLHASIFSASTARNAKFCRWLQKSTETISSKTTARKHVIQIPSSYPFSDYVSALDEGLLRETSRSKSKLREQREKLWERKLEWRRVLKDRRSGFCTMSLLIAIQLVGITPRILRSFCIHPNAPANLQIRQRNAIF